MENEEASQRTYKEKRQQKLVQTSMNKNPIKEPVMLRIVRRYNRETIVDDTAHSGDLWRYTVEGIRPSFDPQSEHFAYSVTEGQISRFVPEVLNFQSGQTRNTNPYFPQTGNERTNVNRSHTPVRTKSPPGHSNNSAPQDVGEQKTCISSDSTNHNNVVYSPDAGATVKLGREDPSNGFDNAYSSPSPVSKSVSHFSIGHNEYYSAEEDEQYFQNSIEAQQADDFDGMEEQANEFNGSSFQPTHHPIPARQPRPTRHSFLKTVTEVAIPSTYSRFCIINYAKSNLLGQCFQFSFCQGLVTIDDYRLLPVPVHSDFTREVARNMATFNKNRVTLCKHMISHLDPSCFYRINQQTYNDLALAGECYIIYKMLEIVYGAHTGEECIYSGQGTREQQLIRLIYKDEFAQEEGETIVAMNIRVCDYILNPLVRIGSSVGDLNRQLVAGYMEMFDIETHTHDDT